jgi:hypothetical protein
MSTTPTTEHPTPFEKFHGALRKIVSVPKSEIVKREAAYKQMRKQKRKQRRN